jgi:hypothetical protein
MVLEFLDEYYDMDHNGSFVQRHVEDYLKSGDYTLIRHFTNYYDTLHYHLPSFDAEDKAIYQNCMTNSDPEDYAYWRVIQKGGYGYISFAIIRKGYEKWVIEEEEESDKGYWCECCYEQPLTLLEFNKEGCIEDRMKDVELSKGCITTEEIEKIEAEVEVIKIINVDPRTTRSDL